MTSFKRQLLLRLFLVEGLRYHANKKIAINYASMMLDQVMTLIKVYTSLYGAWEVYCKSQMAEGGPWKDCSIFTSSMMRTSPHFIEKQKVNFWIYYSLTSGSDSLKIQPADNKAGRGLANEEYEFYIIDTMLVREWNRLFYHHNDVKPETMEKLFVEAIIKALRGLKQKSNFHLEVELLTEAKKNTLWDFLLYNKPYVVEDVAYIVDQDKVNVYSDPYGDEDQEEWGKLWDMNAKYRKLIEQGCTPEMAFHLVIID
jgi:hypothetical protein